MPGGASASSSSDIVASESFGSAARDAAALCRTDSNNDFCTVLELRVDTGDEAEDAIMVEFVLPLPENQNYDSDSVEGDPSP